MADQAAAQPAETVEVKRRRLRFALRDARNGSGKTQQVAAKELSWSTSKIVRIEQGAVPVTPTDVRAMLALYGVADQSDIDSLVALAKEAREERAFKEYADVYSTDALDLFGMESAAKVIYKHEPTVIPGLLQTREYARALMTTLGNSEKTTTRRLEVRAQRQEILDEDVRPELNFVIGEAAVSRPIGGLDVMLEQLEVLRGYSRQENINLQILPFSAGGHRGLATAFTVLQFPNPANPDVLYLEGADRLSISRDDPEQVRHYLDIFAQIEELAEHAGDFLTVLGQITQARYGDAG